VVNLISCLKECKQRFTGLLRQSYIFNITSYHAKPITLSFKVLADRE